MDFHRCGSPQTHHPCRLVHLLKDCQCCHGHKDLSDAMAIKMIRSRQSYLGGYT